MNQFDYIIVGCGSAGSVLADRLSRDNHTSVLVLEAGGSHRDHAINTPGLYPTLQDTRFDWGYRTVPQTHLDGRRIFSPRGKVLGGSSSINYMMYVRGNRNDFDHWRDLGNAGWGWDDVEPYFMKMENCDKEIANRQQGDSGPMHITRSSPISGLSEAFLAAAKQAGLPSNDNFNGERQYGCGQYQRTIYKNQRWSAANAYLDPASTRENLKIATHSFVTKILINSACQITGVNCIQEGKSKTYRANKEVLLCAGAFDSPKLLLVSGIGPADELRKMEVDVNVDLMGVGKNLQDHLTVRIGYEVNEPVSLSALPLSERVAAVKEYNQTKTGPLSDNFLQVGAFGPASDNQDWPKIQFFFLPFLPKIFPESSPDTRHGMMITSSLNRPKSIGQVTLNTRDPLDNPKIDPNYLSSDEDLASLTGGVQFSMDVFSQKAFSGLRAGSTYPDKLPHNKAEIERHIRRECSTLWHVCGTCKMGTDKTSVVDNELRVRGVTGLRVVDASVMPTIVSGNTNAAVLMIAEKAADVLLHN